MLAVRIDRFPRRARPLALLIGTVQAVVLAVGWIVVYQHTHESVARGIEDVIVQSNVAAVETVVDALGGSLAVGEYQSGSWERAQDVVEGLTLGGSGFACILDADGNILCHPDIREDPGLRTVNISDELVRSLDGNSAEPLSSLRDGEVRTGVLDFLWDGKHYIATHLDPSGTRLLIHQPVSGLTAASDRITAGLVVRMIGVGGAVVALTFLMAVFLLRAHERAHGRWNRDLEAKVDERTNQLTRTHRAMIFGIAKLSEYRDNETGKHVERMCAYSGVLARELARRGADIDDGWIRDLELAASLHDIGKVSIPDRILLKPGRLTTEEFSEMQSHASAGEEALRAVRDHVDDTTLLDLGIEIAGGHHERWDGTGYPRGLSGADIPLSARIVAVADVFDALMSKRVYKEAMPFGEVCQQISQGSGRHFDPEAVEAFHAVAEELRAIHTEMQDVDEIPSLLKREMRRSTVRNLA